MRKSFLILLLTSIVYAQDCPAQDTLDVISTETVDEIPDVMIDCELPDDSLVVDINVDMSEEDMTSIIDLETKERKKLEREIDEFVSKELENLDTPR